METATPPATANETTAIPASAVAERVLGIVRDLAFELHPHLRGSFDPGLDSRLDKDMALDSLGRVELMLRLDRAFRVHLPDTLLADAETPRDLVGAVLRAGPARLPEPPSHKSIEPAADVVAPQAAETLVQSLLAHAASHPDRPHIHVWRSDDETSVITYADLDRWSRCVAGGLKSAGVEPGDRVAIMLPTEPGFFAAFFGILYAGAIPVPIYPPFRRSQVEDHLRRQAGILRDAGAALLITTDDFRGVGALLSGLSRDLRGVRTIDALMAAAPVAAPAPAASDTVALIQYTSGSTGDPKGVVLTHGNLVSNIRSMGEAIDATSKDVLVSWLPLYHDMGLIGAWLACLHFGVQTVIMPPLAFLATPARWLKTISAHRATISASPNFAFELCGRSIRDEDIEGVDLSSLRFVLNGAEPVSPDTLERFAERFAGHGLKRTALAPVYGLAENSVGLAFPPVGRGPVIDRVKRDALVRHGRAEPAPAGDAHALRFVACGRPIPRNEVRIVDRSGREIPERHEGRLQFRGPSATQGYFRNPEKTRALYDGKWVETGDRAYIAGGDIYITGRIKDIIIKGGRNIYPQELEEIVGAVPGVRKGCVAAFAVHDAASGTEKLVVMAETRLTAAEETAALKREIMSAATSLDMPPDDVALTPPGTVPKTSSGKIRRTSARELYESGAYGSGKTRALWMQVARLAVSGLLTRLRRGLRNLADLAFGGYWWALLIVTAALAWLGVLALPKRSWRHALVHRASKAFLALTGSGPDVTLDAAVPAGGVVLVANHTSYLDVVILAAALPGELTFVAKEELGRQGIAGPMLRRLGTLFARRSDARSGAEDTSAQRAALAAGERLVSFPEGTLTRMPGLLGFRLGPFLAAAEQGRPLVPVTIRGARTVLRADQWLPRPGRIAVHVGSPRLADGRDFEAAVRLRDGVRTEMLARCGEPDLARERVVPVGQS